MGATIAALCEYFVTQMKALASVAVRIPLFCVANHGDGLAVFHAQGAAHFLRTGGGIGDLERMITGYEGEDARAVTREDGFATVQGEIAYGKMGRFAQGDEVHDLHKTRFGSRTLGMKRERRAKEGQHRKEDAVSEVWWAL